MKKTKEDAIAMNLAGADEHTIQYYNEEYDAIIQVAFAENPMVTTEAKKRGALKKGKYWHSLNACKNTRVKSAIF